MSNLPAGAENDSRAPWLEDPEFECSECGTPVPSEGMICSLDCHRASML